MMTGTLSGLAALAMTGFMIAAFVLLLFMVLIQPIWCVVDCAVDGKRGTASKVIWVIALIVLWGLANWFYGAFAASGRALQRLSWLAWAFAIALLIAFAVLFYSHAEFRRGIEQEWRQRREFVVLAVTPQLASVAGVTDDR